MNRVDFDKHVEGVIDQIRAMLISKGAEYAGDADRLSNFKRNAEKQGVLVTDTWKTYYGKHVDSVDTYIKRLRLKATNLALNVVTTSAGIPPNAEEFEALIKHCIPQAMTQLDHELSEPIEGRFMDIINYCILGMAILKELQQVPDPERGTGFDTVKGPKLHPHSPIGG